MRKNDVSSVQDKLDVLINESALVRSKSILEKLEGRDQWYYLSYPEIIRHFQDSRKLQSKKDQMLRIACVASWIPAVLKSNLDSAHIERIQYFEELYASSTLWEIGTESYLGGIKKPGLEKYHGVRIFQVLNDNHPYLLKDYLEPVAALLNSSERWENTISTTSKYLHFMLPNLFPILDKKIGRTLFEREVIDDGDYHNYIFALQELLPQKRFLLEQSKETGVSPLRLVDNILFNVPIVRYD